MKIIKIPIIDKQLLFHNGRIVVLHRIKGTELHSSTGKLKIGV